MALKTLVKISQVTNLSDARYCAGMGVQLIGFNIDPQSEYYMELMKFREIAEWVAGIDFVGEINDELIYYPSYPIQYLELRNHQELERAKSICEKLILRININDYIDLHEEELFELLKATVHQVEYYLIISNDDKLQIDERKLIQQVAKDYPVILGYGINKNNVHHVLSSVPLKGISLKGSEEIRPGYKDYDELMDILEALEDDD